MKYDFTMLNETLKQYEENKEEIIKRKKECLKQYTLKFFDELMERLQNHEEIYDGNSSTYIVTECFNLSHTDINTEEEGRQLIMGAFLDLDYLKELCSMFSIFMVEKFTSNKYYLKFLLIKSYYKDGVYDFANNNPYTYTDKITLKLNKNNKN